MTESSDAATLERLVEGGQAYEAYAEYKAILSRGEPADPLVHYWGILALRRRGFVVEALNIYLGQDWSGMGGEKFRLLPASLLKELFFQTGERHDFLATRALAIYDEEYQATRRVFPGINAAFLSLVSGRVEAARRIAGEIAEAMAARLPPRGPGGPAPFSIGALYDALTLVEADYIRGRGKEALPVLLSLTEAAGEAGRGAIENCLTQLGRIVKRTGEPAPEIGLGGRKGACAFYSAGEGREADPLLSLIGAGGEGIEAARLRFAERLVTDGVVHLTGGAAPGYELAMAAAALSAGLPVRLVLPYDGDEYRAREIVPCGEPWPSLFDHVILGAQSVSAFGGAPDEGEAETRLLSETRQVSAGLVAVESASQGRPALFLRAPSQADAIARLALDTGDHGDGSADGAPGGPATAPVAGEENGALPRQTFVSSIFCDLVGASKLRERDCVAIFATLYQRIAEKVGRTATVLEANTWGDAIFLVFSDVTEAADAALDIRRITDRILAENWELDICFRVACHYGPAFEIFDPVRGVRAFTGASVTKAARIEPVTPPGNVYVTQSFAGKLMSGAGATGYTLEPVGRIKLAKSYGTEGVFNLRRSDFDITERELRLLRAHFAAPPPPATPASGSAPPGA